MDSSGRRHHGLLTGDDLARWEVPVEAPLTFDYRGYTVAKGGPWSQGPVFLQQLALLQGFDLDELDPLHVPDDGDLHGGKSHRSGHCPVETGEWRR